MYMCVFVGVVTPRYIHIYMHVALCTSEIITTAHYSTQQQPPPLLL